VTVSSLSGVTAIAAGTNHTCAVYTSGGTTGGVKCWGLNGDGQLGDNATTDQTSPVSVIITSGGTLLTGASKLAAGFSHTCVLTTSGGAKCWGASSDGQLGTGNTTWYKMPTDVNGLTSGVTAIVAGGYHSCAISSGAVKCWGRNSAGELGNNSTSNSSTPVQSISSGAANIALGKYFTCATLGKLSRPVDCVSRCLSLAS
jgi:alpha-tubulin suppressor-like RCC1 family protein